jgi:hypothetical protein
LLNHAKTINPEVFITMKTSVQIYVIIPDHFITVR